MKVLITETVTQTAIIDVPDHLTGEQLREAVEVAKHAHDDSGTAIYEHVQTVSWAWAPAPHFGRTFEPTRINSKH